jgi:hypothetical protein
MSPREHFDQGGLARTVLAEQAMHFAGTHLEVDTVQRPNTRERLYDAAHPQQWLSCGV